MLTQEFGKGFSVKNLARMRTFYQIYRKSSTLMSKSENTKPQAVSDESKTSNSKTPTPKPPTPKNIHPSPNLIQSDIY